MNDLSKRKLRTLGYILCAAFPVGLLAAIVALLHAPLLFRCAAKFELRDPKDTTRMFKAFSAFQEELRSGKIEGVPASADIQLSAVDEKFEITATDVNMRDAAMHANEACRFIFHALRSDDDNLIDVMKLEVADPKETSTEKVFPRIAMYELSLGAVLSTIGILLLMRYRSEQPAQLMANKPESRPYDY